MIPMLAEPGDVARLADYIADPAWTFEQKVDGHRKLVVVEDGKVTVLGRDGQVTTLPANVVEHFRRLAPQMPGTWAFDGEIVPGPTGTFWLFDLPCAATRITPATGWAERRAVLGEFYGRLEWPSSIRLLPWARTPVAKAELAEKVRANRGEGVIAKKVNAGYVGVRTFDVIKLKYRQDVDCVVTRVRVDSKANMEVGVYRAGKLVTIGEVTALAGDGPRVLRMFDDITTRGAHDSERLVVCVRYQHCTADDRLFQPTLPRLRTDKAAIECTADQLVYVNKTVIDVS